MRHFVSAALALALAAPVAAQGQDKPAPMPPNTKVEGMAAIPQSVLDGVARYGQYRAARMIAWHPAKRQMIVSTSFSSSPVIPQIHLIDGPGRDRRQLTWFPAPGLPTITLDRAALLRARAWAAEVRDSRLRADARAGEKHHGAALSQMPGELL